MSLTTPNWIQYTEKVVGKNHPTLSDIVNRPMQTIQANVETVQANVETVQANVETVQANVETVQANVDTVQANVDAHKSSHVVSNWHYGSSGYSTSSASYVNVASEFNISVTLGTGNYTVMAQAVLHKVDMANNGYTANFKLSCGGVTDYSTRNNGGGDTDSDIALHTVASGVSGSAAISLQWRVPGGSSVSCAYVTVSILAIRES